jgi:hypothetical protein
MTSDTYALRVIFLHSLMLKCGETEILFSSNLLRISKTYFVISVNEKQRKRALKTLPQVFQLT